MQRSLPGKKRCLSHCSSSRNKQHVLFTVSKFRGSPHRRKETEAFACVRGARQCVVLDLESGGHPGCCTSAFAPPDGPDDDVYVCECAPQELLAAPWSWSRPLHLHSNDIIIETAHAPAGLHGGMDSPIVKF